MGAEAERDDARPLRQRPLALVLLLAATAAISVVLGETLLGSLAVAAGVLAAGWTVGLAGTRTLRAERPSSRALCLAAFYLGQVVVLGGFWMTAQKLTHDSDWLGSGLIFGGVMGAIYAWDLWRAATGTTSRLRLPQFGVADRSGRPLEQPRRDRG